MPNPHPLIVHFPIALFITAFLCEVLGYFLRSRMLSTAAMINGVAAAAMAFGAVVTGLLAKGLVPPGPAVFVLDSHETMGYLVLVSSIFFAALKVYSFVKNTDKYLTAAIAIGLLGLVFTFVAAHEGGELVYKYGVGVQEEPPKPAGQYPYGTPYNAPADSSSVTIPLQ